MKITTKEFVNILYNPLIETKDRDVLSKLYLGAKGSHERAMTSCRIDQLWRNMAETDLWVKDIENYASILPHNLNYTVTPRTRPDAKQRYVAGSCCLWVDIDDFLFYKWKANRYPKLAGTWMEPNILVDSGWGVHLYWLFDSFASFAEGSSCSVDESKFTKAMKILSWYTGADFATCSPEHLMRLPGTYNCKSSPNKPTEITLISERRRSFEDFLSELETGIKSISESSKTPDIIKNTIEALLRTPKDNYTNTNFTNTTVNVKGTDIALKKLQANPMKCHVLERAFNYPSELGYTAWYSIGTALNKLISNNELAFDIFRQLSLPGNRSNDPEGEIKQKFNSIVQAGYMPSSPAKIPECTGCPLFISGECRNIITIIRKTIQ